MLLSGYTVNDHLANTLHVILTVLKCCRIFGHVFVICATKQNKKEPIVHSTKSEE